MLEVGKSYCYETEVRPEQTALAVGSGDLEVLGTPAMIALMEHAAVLLLREELEEGSSTVGSFLKVNHLKPTRVGGKLKVKATLTKAEGRHLFLDLKAEDENGVIGEGTHERFIVDVERFMKKAE